MKEYKINKGIGRTVEFRGLKAQYLFIFAGGLLGITWPVPTPTCACCLGPWEVG